ncbi:MAG: mechanosensitive ion channel, partial [Desulfobulbales bacterium]|nr:mechanosensitive ion channel [Desulfobulbales bacterium]
LADGLSKGFFYLLMLFVLIAFFEALNLKIITEPIQDLLSPLAAFVPNLIGAGVMLLIAWGLATVLSLLITKGMTAMAADEKLARIFDKEAEEPLPVTKTISTIVYIFIFVLFLPGIMGALSTTALGGILEPIQGLLDKTMAFIPNIFAAAIFLLVFWIIAKIVRQIVTTLLASLGVDTFGEKIGLEKQKLSAIAGAIVYILIIIPGITLALDSLNLGSITEPISNMLNLVLEKIPTILIAAVVLGAGFLFAGLARKFITEISASAGADTLSEKVGGEALKISGLLGTLAYFFIIVPILIATLDILELNAVTAPISNMLNIVLSSLPSIFTAAVILAIGYYVGRIVARLATEMLTGFGFNSIPEKLGLASMAPAEGEAAANVKTPAGFVGGLVLAGIMLFAAIEASEILGFTILSELTSQFIVFAGQVLTGIIILGIGLFLANLAAKAIKASSLPSADFVSFAARVAIIIFASAMALGQMGIASQIINMAFGLLLGAIAVAIAIAFGLGGRDSAAAILEEWRAKK